MITFSIEKEIAEIGNTKKLCLVSWNGRGAKLDVRPWLDEGKKPGKGLTLSDDEGRALLDALKAYFEGDGKETP